MLEQIELPAKPLDYFLWSNKSNIYHTKDTHPMDTCQQKMMFVGVTVQLLRMYKPRQGSFATIKKTQFSTEFSVITQFLKVAKVIVQTNM